LACRSIGNSDVADHWPDLQPGRYIELTVADTGIGMDALTREHVFEPFFTTKEIGRGTGLGLASVYGVVHSYGGRIRVASRIGQGSTFTIVFPASTDRLPASAKVPRETPAPASGGTLLVVEDEPTILELSLEMVQSLGFNALSATSGEEAVRLYQRHQASIDLVLLDIIMPGMDGWTAFQELKKINAQVKVIITSGYGVTNRKKRILSGTPHGTLQKPYTRATLAKMIAKVLAIPAPAGALPAL
jgi:CheY-like chemotaxis protein